ncbi:class 1b ribonucleoside-diphosphate reductase subunit alpha [Candidatus Mycoplasma haematominutum]|uniref:Ribonucleoside-diphosphate reductase n=1 Tax=Candidatus Mycoplasma haematominutum 'Birmingham 1' TaxID=1116213 RepID=G8C2Y7_9MOLU|nr:class 1b ribonucleoside-diphosphate reductase subunit alpha [Candidatus Mycoplasma haematominutum]CCE66685.1 ribonucleotide reductase of class Ib (aerobic),alpha subunit [Candidatus Mycoplasma haematominutum 'Birmingham 1']
MNKPKKIVSQAFYDSLILNNQVTMMGEDGFYCLEKDELAIKEYQKYISETERYSQKKRGHQRIKWLIEEEYYLPELVQKYSEAQINKLSETVYNTPFKWKSYISISKFFESFAMRSNCGKYILESYEDRVIVASLFLGNGDFELASKIANLIIRQIFQPATPTFSNAGKKRSGELVSCFLLEVEDSINSINYVISTSMQLSKIGGGVAINLSKLRGRGASIKKIDSTASGVLPVLKILENVFDYADQLGMRRGSGAAYLNIFHYDLIDFIDCKKINADEKSRIQTLSIGLIVPDKFLELAKDNKDFFIFEPNTIYQKYGVFLSDLNFDEWYEKLANDTEILKKQLSARAILTKIAQTQFESGYPYVIFIDNANRQNPLKALGKIKMSNLCTEIFQIQESSHITDYGEEDLIRNDVSCNLASLNLVNVIEDGNLEEIIEVSMRALSAVSDLTSIKNAPSVRKANEEYKSVGLGILNFTGFLIKHNIEYGSPESLEFADVFFAAVNYYSLLASSKIAKERKIIFKDFEKSDYASGKFFELYCEQEFLPKSEKIRQLVSHLKLPTRGDWIKLREKVKNDGLYNSYRLAIAPTQSISYLQGATASIQPIISPIETRMYGSSITYFPMPFLSKDNQHLFCSAYHIDQKKLIDMSATIQTHIDQGISTILYVTNNSTTRDLVKLYLYAHHKGLKSLYYVRTKNLQPEECELCQA